MTHYGGEDNQIKQYEADSYRDGNGERCRVVVLAVDHFKTTIAM